MVVPIRKFQVDHLPVEIYASNTSLGEAAAMQAAKILKTVLAKKAQANAIFATGNSQLTFFQALLQQAGIEWTRVNIFHMDEYVGMPASHPASFRRYLHEKLVDRVKPQQFFGVEGDSPDPSVECAHYEALLKSHPADMCCLGIGENGHLAFNDPPFANFKDPRLVKIVTLDERSRRQQVGEGHFPNLESVPTHAITLTIPALLAARQVLAIVPEGRKAQAVQSALHGPVTTDCPASILRQNDHAILYLDNDSAALV
jgi:glucosamine-6-phosphate deaminase